MPFTAEQKYRINDVLTALADEMGVEIDDDTLNELTHHVADVLDTIDLDGLTGECDDCDTKYVPSSTMDHCGECGCCFDHCKCEGGPNPHIRAILDEEA